jgi:RNA polymerase sigma-70 factor (sigma-E family)
VTVRREQGSRAAGEHDEAAFRQFVEASHATLLRTAWLLTGDRWLAEDLVQTAFTATYLHWRTVDVPEAYARTALMRDAVRGRRRRQLEQPSADLPDLAVPDGSEAADTAHAVRRALETLPVNQRAVLVLRYWSGSTEAEIASALGCRPGTVKSRATRALAALRESGLLSFVPAVEEAR